MYLVFKNLVKSFSSLVVACTFRVLSHGQITFGDREAEAEDTTMPPKSGGHRRTASKTDFILPPGKSVNARDFVNIIGSYFWVILTF